MKIKYIPSNLSYINGEWVDLDKYQMCRYCGFELQGDEKSEDICSACKVGE